MYRINSKKVNDAGPIRPVIGFDFNQSNLINFLGMEFKLQMIRLMKILNQKDDNHKCLQLDKVTWRDMFIKHYK